MDDVRGIEDVTRAVGGRAPAIFHEQNALAGRADQREGQVRNARMFDDKADIQRRDLLRAGNENGGIGHGVIQQHRPVVGRVIPRLDGRRRTAKHGQQFDIVWRGVGIEKADEIPSGQERRAVGNGIPRISAGRVRPEWRIGQIGFKEVVRKTRLDVKVQIKLQRWHGSWRQVRGENAEVGESRRHVNVGIKPGAPREGEGDSPRQVLVRLDQQVEAGHTAGLRQ